jgi:purine-binding chemotaxis protein CheW
MAGTCPVHGASAQFIGPLTLVLSKDTPQTRNEMEKETESMEERTRDVNLAREDISEREGKHLTFSLDREEYGIGILKVKEIIGMMRITPVPQTPEFVKGVINLRGKVIPVIDLRLRFGMHSIEYNDRTCIIVVEINANWSRIHTGIVVDSVSEVLNIKGSDIEDAPTFGAKLNTDYILGMAKMGGGVKILLDIDRVLSAQELDVLEAAA